MCLIISFSRTFVFQTFVSLLLFLSHVESLVFNFTHFDANAHNIIIGNDSNYVNGAIQLTKNRADVELQRSAGRASYYQPMRLWDKGTNMTTNFTTHFSFEIIKLDSREFNGDGFAFFLAPFDESTYYAANNSEGGCLGLVGGADTGYCNISSKYPFVAVEFDTFQNQWDPSLAHLGIDVNSVVSNTTLEWSSGLMNKTKGNAWITYDSSTKNLSVYLTYDPVPVFNGESSLSYAIDLSSILPETVRVGFSSATGMSTELHNVLSWDFNSTLADPKISLSASPLRNHTTTSPPRAPVPRRKHKSKLALAGGLIAGISVIIVGLGLVKSKWSNKSGERSEAMIFEVDDEFDNEMGPRRFMYNELCRATNKFSEEGKLGEGGFGGVYRGFLTHLCREIAVKKISRGSKQGKKEYVSEIRIISRLRHKNLVQLLGWCHEQGDLLLVYEFMPNGSLDTHLYADKRKAVIPWMLRYKIAQGLASALLYLHEEWEQCVLHRDIKPSNVMLDSSFNAKLGDFGLARLVDHNLGAQTTVLAGTLGYLAPECVITGHATKESDVYSFGVVALEIACGRRPIESREEPREVRMIEWVWNLYGEGRVLEAIDKGLEGDFDIQEIKSLMIVGLWCCHPEYTLRPSIRQVINVLNFEYPLPSLPMKFPIPIYGSTPMNLDAIYTTSSGISSSSGTTSSSHSVVSCAAPLLFRNANV